MEVHPKKDRAELPREGAHPIHAPEQGNRSPAIRYRESHPSYTHAAQASIKPVQCPPQ